MRTLFEPRVRLSADLTVDREVSARVGDAAGFVPMVRFSRWDGEATASIRLLHDALGLATTDQQAIVWTTADLEARFYALGLSDGGGFEFSIHLPQRPASNIFRFALDAPGLDIDDQPALEHADQDGSTWGTNPWGGRRQRPAWAVNSFTLYHPARHGDYSACGGQNYRTGKVLHLHRAWACDAVGHFAWCAQSYAGGVLALTVPPEFLASAVYPVVVDPTFGYSGTAASDDNIGQAHLWALAVTTPASNGTLDSMTIKGRIKNSATGTPTFEPALYSDNAAVPDARLAAVNTGGTVFGASDAEVTTNISYGSLVASTQYWLGFRSDNGDGALIDAWFKYDASGGTGNTKYSVPVVGTDWETPSAFTNSIDNEKVYIYATYTASGGGTPSVPPLPLRFGRGKRPNRRRRAA